jgi:hypothetical protein
MRARKQEKRPMLRTLVFATLLAATLGGSAMAHPWHHCWRHHHHHHHCW